MSEIATTTPTTVAPAQGEAPPRTYRARALDYAILLKPRVMSLVVFVGLAGVLLAPGPVEPWSAAIAVICIAFGAGASGAINMWYERDIDIAMRRTMDRPLPSKRLTPGEALIFGATLAAASVTVMGLAVNITAAALLAATILYYIFVYTVWLKRRTPYNVVIGGVSGALPPAIGWAAATGQVGIESLVLFLIIFLWTPPHSWALALFSNQDYARAGIPMLPVVRGAAAARRQMLIYTALLIPVTFLPVVVGLGGLAYAAAVSLLNVEFARRTILLWRSGTEDSARSLFGYSILYLFLLFVVLLLDRLLAG
ncbi:MAG: protoheme IX farnesyltransferase [Rhodospirillales bacterium]|nr:protoheme IX farnesyltransferase [Rhodospirillales bacterium]